MSHLRYQSQFPKSKPLFIWEQDFSELFISECLFEDTVPKLEIEKKMCCEITGDGTTFGAPHEEAQIFPLFLIIGKECLEATCGQTTWSGKEQQEPMVLMLPHTQRKSGTNTSLKRRNWCPSRLSPRHTAIALGILI